jgi:hypothetical protein
MITSYSRESFAILIVSPLTGLIAGTEARLFFGVEQAPITAISTIIKAIFFMATKLNLKITKYELGNSKFYHKKTPSPLKK